MSPLFLLYFQQTTIAATEISHPETDMKEVAHVSVSSINTNPESIIQPLQNKTQRQVPLLSNHFISYR